MENRGTRTPPAGFEPAYLNLLRSGKLLERVRQAWARLESCDLCARDCHVNRRQTIKGAVCRTGECAVVASFHQHFGEEACLVGARGSGTIFFSWCNLRCQFCQNYDIAQLGGGRKVEPHDIAAMMLRLQAQGCHNLNFVSPSHVVPQILEAVHIAAERGLAVPLVYNTGGYDAQETLRLLEGVVDMYMPDVKYADAALARKYSKVRNYAAINRAAIKEMHRQVGDLRLDENGIALRGLLVRHLVLPNGIAGTAQIARFLAEEISPNTYLNVMDQYRPCYKACRIPELERRITPDEYREALRVAAAAGLRRLEGRGSWQNRSVVR